MPKEIFCPDGLRSTNLERTSKDIGIAHRVIDRAMGVLDISKPVSWEVTIISEHVIPSEKALQITLDIQTVACKDVPPFKRTTKDTRANERLQVFINPRAIKEQRPCSEHPFAVKPLDEPRKGFDSNCRLNGVNRRCKVSFWLGPPPTHCMFIRFAIRARSEVPHE